MSKLTEALDTLSRVERLRHESNQTWDKLAQEIERGIKMRRDQDASTGLQYADALKKLHDALFSQPESHAENIHEFGVGSAVGPGVQ